MISDVRTIAGHALREALRRRVFVVVVVLSLGFLGLFALGVKEAFDTAEGLDVDRGAIGLEERVLTGATLLGLAMFVTLFLGVVLSVFLTLTAVRGDAAAGLLQPLVVRPVGRTTLLLGRFLAAAGVCVPYVLAMFATATVITGLLGDWWPDRPVVTAAGLAGAVATVVALSLLGSTVLSTTANGICVFMVFGAGLAAGLLGQIGEALDSPALQDVSSFASWALPFEALYQQGLHALTADVGGITGVAVQLGPFGGAQDSSPLLWPFAAAYVLAVGALADRIFRRADL